MFIFFTKKLVVLFFFGKLKYKRYDRNFRLINLDVETSTRA